MKAVSHAMSTPFRPGDICDACASVRTCVRDRLRRQRRGEKNASLTIVKSASAPSSVMLIISCGNCATSSRNLGPCLSVAFVRHLEGVEGELNRGKLRLPARSETMATCVLRMRRCVSESVRGPFIKDVRTGRWVGGCPKADKVRRGCVDLVLYFITKCGHGEGGQIYRKFCGSP